MPPPVSTASTAASSNIDPANLNTEQTSTQNEPARPTAKAAKTLVQHFGDALSRLIPKRANVSNQQAAVKTAAQNPYKHLSQEGQKLMMAAQTGDLKMLNEIISTKPELLNEKIGQDQTTTNPDGSISGSNSSTLGQDALREAAKNNHSQVAIALIQAKVDPGAFDNLALRLSLAKGHSETAQILLALQADLQGGNLADAESLAINTLIEMKADTSPEGKKATENARSIVDTFRTNLTEHHSLEDQWVNWIQSSGKDTKDGPDFSKMFSWLPPEQREEALVNFILHYSNPDNQIDPADLSGPGSELAPGPKPSPVPAPASASASAPTQPSTRQARTPASAPDAFDPSKFEDDRGQPLFPERLDPFDSTRSS